MKTFFEYLVRDLKYWKDEVSGHETNGTNKGSTSEVLINLCDTDQKF